MKKLDWVLCQEDRYKNKDSCLLGVTANQNGMLHQLKSGGRALAPSPPTAQNHALLAFRSIPNAEQQEFEQEQHWKLFLRSVSVSL